MRHYIIIIIIVLCSINSYAIDLDYDIEVGYGGTYTNDEFKEFERQPEIHRGINPLSARLDYDVLLGFVGAKFFLILLDSDLPFGTTNSSILNIGYGGVIQFSISKLELEASAGTGRGEVLLDRVEGKDKHVDANYNFNFISGGIGWEIKGASQSRKSLRFGLKYIHIIPISGQQIESVNLSGNISTITFALSYRGNIL